MTRVVDLCAAPGSWSQVLSRVLAQGERFGCAAWLDREARVRRQMLGVVGGGDDADDSAQPRDDVKVVAVDLQPMAPLLGIADAGARPVDLVLSDGAPDVTGLHDLDTYVQSQLLLAALNLALCVLRPGGRFVAKIFRGCSVDLLYAQLRPLFARVVVAKPRNSRASSVEAFVVRLGFRPGLDESLGTPRRPDRLAAKRQGQLPVVAPALVQDPATGAWSSCEAAPGGVTEMHVYDMTGDGDGDGDSRGTRWIAPFIACGDLSAFDSDASYRLPENHLSLGPVQPPIAPPYKRAVAMRTAQSRAPN